MSKKTKAALSKKERNIQQTHPASMFSPFEWMRQWSEHMPTRWGRHFRGDWPSWDELSIPFEGRIPTVDVIDRDNKIVVRAEIPGVDKKDLDISVTENSVRIKGSVQHEEEEEKEDYYHREISSGAFVRTVMLPDEIDTDTVKTKFKDGVLKLTMRKLNQSQRKKITVE